MNKRTKKRIFRRTTLGASLLGNMLIGKGMLRAGYEKGMLRAGYGNKMDF